MKTALVAAITGSTLALGVVQAHAGQVHSMPAHVVLHVARLVQSRADFKHAMASAKLTYTAHDVTIIFSSDGLPGPHALGRRAYVLFAGNGAMTEKVGTLHLSRNMAGVAGTIMMSKVQDLYVYAESHPGKPRPNGTLVLSGMA